MTADTYIYINISKSLLDANVAVIKIGIGKCLSILPLEISKNCGYITNYYIHNST
jgi:hypothetical protein